MEVDGELSRFFASFFQNSMLKFFDDLFNHVLKETEGIECMSQFSDLPMVFPLYQRNVGVAVVQILEVAGPSINRLFEGIREKIEDKANLRTFISRLGSRFIDGPAENCLYFLTVTSRIFALMFKSNTDLNSLAFIQDCVKALESTAAGPNALAGFRDLPVLVAKILKSDNWRDKFREMNCGDASDYFPSS